jgi:hypothetical protein
MSYLIRVGDSTANPDHGEDADVFRRNGQIAALRNPYDSAHQLVNGLRAKGTLLAWTAVTFCSWYFISINFFANVSLK